MTHFLALSPRDPLVARDGRPFGRGQGRRMRSLDWPMPSMIAGSLRTALGKQIDPEFPSDLVEQLKSIEFAGPFPWSEGRMFLPAPADAVCDANNHAYRLRPSDVRGGTDLPASLQPVMLPAEAPENFKPEEIPAWWSVDRMVRWLCYQQGDAADAPTDFFPADHDPNGSQEFRAPPAIDERTHLEVDPERLAAADGMLFSTASLAFGQRHDDGIWENKLVVRVDALTSSAELQRELQACRTLHPVGGERRLAQWEQATTAMANAWQSVAQRDGKAALQGVRRVRMVLATPAAFSGGWCPGWLQSDLTGAPPGLEQNSASKDLRLKLVGVCNRRWRAVSGFSVERDQQGRRLGPKPICRLVPAGAVYFFEVQGDGDAAALASLWLKSVSDDDVYRRDGFGLALWGVW